MYKIVRHYFNRTPNHRTIDTGLTLAEAQDRCHSPESSSKTCTTPAGRRRTRQLGPWFDGYAQA